MLQQAIFSNILDYYPFGMVTPGRSYSAGSGYRFDFNGKESDPETYGSGNIYDYGFRIYNPRLGKFLSVDPLTSSYPALTPFQFASNTPIQAIDLDGLEAVYCTWFEFYYSRPELKASEWYVIEGQVDWQSFNAAAVYNTSNSNPDVYKSVEDRHNWYSWADEIGQKKDVYWYGAAADVTGPFMVGRAEKFNFWFISSDAKDFLIAANVYLFTQNMNNFGSFLVEKDGKIKNEAGWSLYDYSTADLDEEMVRIEQVLLDNFIVEYKTEYLKSNSIEAWDQMVANINYLFENDLFKQFTPEANKYAAEEFDKKYGTDEDFDFMNLDHRIFLGKKIAEYHRLEANSAQNK
ncbi:MAG TPA: RHS repeat-associated core domain-containing protein [Chitinophagales bacterium]|nr:RHS repeat-associated core domain-containing protein [Chitinophagales bacterium]HNI54739.1 RHS repeat-associated core domain-containing protein [Chitinophagales bacterium]HNJ88926.1 RHS repeat-associated core domain-containing protein [Chitinophagales bacterium]HNM28796.1 RHS repeat-associated core domain-containing protein [Chitinophagales bacterium]